MKRLKRHRSSWIRIALALVWLTFIGFWTVGNWKQPNDSLMKRESVERRQEEDRNTNILGLSFGLLFSSFGVACLIAEFTSSFALEVSDQKIKAAYELSDDQFVEIGPMRGLNGNAIALSLYYSYDWEPQLETFTFYRQMPPLCYISYHVQLLDDQAKVISDQTFFHSNPAPSAVKGKPRWTEKIFPVSDFSTNYTLRIQPIFDRKSLALFDKNVIDKRLTIDLHIKLAVCVAPNQLRKVEPKNISISRAHAIVHRVLDVPLLSSSSS